MCRRIKLKTSRMDGGSTFDLRGGSFSKAIRATMIKPGSPTATKTCCQAFSSWAKGMPIAYQLNAPEGFKRELLEKVSKMLDEQQ